MDRLTNKKEILKEISNLKNGKRCGLDEINNEFLKAVANIIADQIVKLFN